ncbi:hypothetical protein ACFWDI_22350 [Streptomyces sp. NPDC060064]|uniref:hypothetical protein n=1 Tax=Streptomyces sp. NPDC060064 TaxID=3347049 RepID=UPI003688EC88
MSNATGGNRDTCRTRTTPVQAPYNQAHGRPPTPYDEDDVRPSYLVSGPLTPSR